MVILLKIKRRDFFQRHSVAILVSRTVKTRKFKLLYFRNTTCYGRFTFCLSFVYLQPSVNKNSYKLAICSLFWLYNLMTSLWKSSILNTRSKETEYFSSFCSLNILMFLFYNLSTSKRGQDINFWGSSQVLWVSFPHNVTNNDKSLKKSLISIRLKKRLDHLQRIVKRTCWSDYVYRVDVSKSFLSSRARKKTKQK